MRTIEKSPEPVSSNGHQATAKHGGDHVFIVPSAMEDGGTLGAHALALLKMLAEYVTVAPKGCYSSPESRRSPLTPAPHACRSARFGCSAGSSAFLPGFTLACHNRFCASTVLYSAVLQVLG